MKAKEELKSAVRRQGQPDKKQHKIVSSRYPASKVPTCSTRTRGASPKTSYQVVPLTNMSPPMSPTSRDTGQSNYLNSKRCRRSSLIKVLHTSESKRKSHKSKSNKAMGQSRYDNPNATNDHRDIDSFNRALELLNCSFATDEDIEKVDKLQS